MEYKIVIGLEVHVALLTANKLFCSCPTRFGAEPNTQVCPVCLGLPGALPVLNSAAVTQALRGALALGCKINLTSSFARKHYFYPDLPKGYQVTQVQPLAQEGRVDTPEGVVTIARLHIEEDAGKLFHDEGSTLVDFNRSGIPLAEIVTDPCLDSPAQARAFLETLKQIMDYTGVSDCKMEEGSLRCDVNISLGRDGGRTEIKNLNSFRSVERALVFEAARQSRTLNEGGAVLPQTLRWDEENNRTVPMRSKEAALEYRFLPEPDLPPLFIEQAAIQRELECMPELPLARTARYVQDYHIPEADARILTRTREMADWFEQTTAAGVEPRQAANWLTGEVSRLLNRGGLNSSQIPFAPDALARLIELNRLGKVSTTAAKEVLAEMFATREEPEEIIHRRGLAQVSDTQELEALVQRIMAENPDAVKEFQSGQSKVLGYLMGHAMKLSQGKANPEILKKIMLQKLL